MKNVVMIVDLQYGSCGKGQIAGSLGRQWEPDTVVCANGPNAGHTYMWAAGVAEADGVGTRKIMHTVMPVGAVLPSVRNILIGPGAVIDTERLQQELTASADLLIGKRLIIHPNAAVVRQHHRDAETGLVGIGSTMKGTAEAVIEKMRRQKDASIAHNNRIPLELFYAGQGPERFIVIVDEGEYNAALDSSFKLLVEGAQGASLSMHSRFYPYTTSRDVSINQIWADCRLPARTDAARWARDGYVEIVGVCRTYPIRVANRYTTSEASEIRQIGYSGDCYSDQRELQWPEIGREAELTTVTKLPRRLFTFSTKQILDAVRYNAPTSIALTFCDYLSDVYPDHPLADKMAEPFSIGLGERVSPAALSLIRRIEAASSSKVEFVSYGAKDTDLYMPVGRTFPTAELRTPLIPWQYGGRVS